MKQIPKKIDLHMHSTVSDGTDTPEALLRRASEVGLELFSLTDHDAIKGCEQILSLRKTEDPLFLPGVEFSCRDEDGKYHILGYGYDANTEPIRSAVARGHRIRMRKIRLRLDHLKTQFGFTFPEDEVEALVVLDNPGKPHIGNLMVKHGFAPTKEIAIKNYLDQLPLRSDFIRPEEAIAGILGSGGVPVLAHPCYGSGDELILGEALEKRVKKLMDFGLQGLEAFYSGFSEKLRAEVLALAERYDLYVTAGSDYHGTNKLVMLGSTGLDPTMAPVDGMRRFWDHIGAPFV